MIVSHRHKFIFIKTRKTAGTSIEILLSTICAEGDILTPLSGTDEAKRLAFAGRGAQNYELPYKKYGVKAVLSLLKYGSLARYYNHMSAADVRSRVGARVWDSYFTFCFERQPLSKLISHYQWQKQQGVVQTPKEYMAKRAYQKIAANNMYLNPQNDPLLDAVFKVEQMDLALQQIDAHLNLEGKLTSLAPAATKKSEPAPEEEIKFLKEQYRQRLQEEFQFEIGLYNKK